MSGLTASDKAWAFIDEEKRRETLLRRISKWAWITAFLIVLTFSIIWGIHIIQMIQMYTLARLPDRENILRTATPLFVALGFMSVLVATVSTIGMFMRFRAASLTEIQLRLAALEDMLIGDSDRVSSSHDKTRTASPSRGV